MKNKSFAPMDHILALICAAAVFFCALCGITGDCDWGDDMSAYLSDGIAIAEGTYEEKTQLNYYMHPSDLPDEAGDGRLVYSWGFPLLQSIVYKAVGFDRTDFHTIPYYKLPASLCLGLLAAVLYFFFRRRFSKICAIFLSVFFCLNSEFLISANMMMSDVPFMLFTMLGFLLLERFQDSLCGASTGKKIALAILSGLALWYTRETRLNGNAVIVCAAAGHVLFLLRNRGSGRPSAVNLLPYAVFAVMTILSERVFMLPATSNSSDILNTQLSLVLSHVEYYIFLMYWWFISLPLIPRSMELLCKAALAAAFLLFALGAFATFKENLHYLLLIIGTFAVLLLLPYDQGVRYFFFILPLMLLFVCEGAAFIWRKISPRLSEKAAKLCLTLAAAATLLTAALSTADTARDLLTQPVDAQYTGPYTAEAIEMYGYIQNNTAEAAIIVSPKPRFIYLNTLRKGFAPDRNGHTLDEADYYLLFKFAEQEPPAAGGVTYELAHSNDKFALYSIVP